MGASEKAPREGEKPRGVPTKETSSGEGECGSEGGKEMSIDAQICNQLVARGSADNPSEACGGMARAKYDFGADLSSDVLAEERLGVEAGDSCSSPAESPLG